MRKTKIVCTIGPASDSEETLRALADAGMNVARLNFSHGDYKEHGARIKRIKRMNRGLAHPVAILLDTRGPEIRTGYFEKDIELKKGDTFTFRTKDSIDEELGTTVTYAKLSSDVKAGDHIFVDDGLIEFEVMQVKDEKIACKVLNDGTLSSRKGVNIPGVDIHLPSLAEKDIEDINFGILHEVDFIAASFVKTKKDVVRIRKILDKKKSSARVIAKIEHSIAVKNIDEIIDSADGIMIARGDLGLEIPFEEVPLVQAEIFEKCNLAGKPVITATHMLNSMIDSPRPTRAEVSDVAGSILGGTDAVMLSAETAKGKYPVESVKVFDKICKKADDAVKPNFDIPVRKGESVFEIVAHAVANAAERMNAKAILTFTSTGNTACMLARYRSHVPVFAFTRNAQIRKKLSLVWGAESFQLDKTSGTSDKMITKGICALLENKIIKKGDTVVITAGISVGKAGVTNMAEIRVV